MDIIARILLKCRGCEGVLSNTETLHAVVWLCFEWSQWLGLGGQFSPSVWPHNPATGFRPPSATVVSAEPFCTEQGHCGACRRKWRLTDTDLCPCGETQTMSYIVESCPWQNWMAAYLGCSLRMKTLFRGWPVIKSKSNKIWETYYSAPPPELWGACYSRLKIKIHNNYYKMKLVSVLKWRKWGIEEVEMKLWFMTRIREERSANESQTFV